MVVSHAVVLATYGRQASGVRHNAYYCEVFCDRAPLVALGGNEKYLLNSSAGYLRLPITNYQLPDGPVKAGRRWGQRHPQGANLGSNGILLSCPSSNNRLPPAHPKSLAYMAGGVEYQVDM